MRVTQVLVAASPGDAITNSALEIDAALPDDIDSSICARHIDSRIAESVVPLSVADRGHRTPQPDDLLVLHLSIGEPDVAAWVGARPERLVVYYHNISPPEFFDRHDPAFAHLLRLGRQEVLGYRDRAVLALGASAFNADELVKAGFQDVRVSPLVYDPSRLTRLGSHPPTATHLSEAVRGPVVVSVGQLLPHKRPDYLIEAFYILVTHLIPEAHLIMVGPGRLPAYRQTLQRLIDELQLTTAWLTGHVTDSELATFYRRGDVFATASEHEGFCAPLLEAMSFGLPIVARPFAAIPATLGPAGLLVGRHDGPSVFAEALAEVLNDRSISADLREQGHRRVGAFDPAQARSAVVRHILSVV